MNRENIDFSNLKGLWIPYQILLNENLTLTDRVVFAIIDNFTTSKGNCFASNIWIAKALGVSESAVVNSITKLRKMEFIKDVSFDGRKRVIKSCLSKVYEEVE